MNKCKFFIIDDDQSIIRMLSNIIEDNDLGLICGTAADGETAVDSILVLKPEIVLIDYLLPKMDGASIVSKVNQANLTTKFVMISQVNSPEMVAQAYKSGIEFFISKPINVIEVTSVIKNIQQTIQLRQTLNLISSVLDTTKETLPQKQSNFTQKQIQAILTDLGIWGDTGTDDLVKLILNFLESDSASNHLQLADLYDDLHQEYKKIGIMITPQGIEQRIRRIIQKAMHNLVILGLEDFSNDKFVLYSSMLFDFKEIKKEMDYLQNKNKHSGRIQIRKFVNGIISQLKEI